MDDLELDLDLTGLNEDAVERGGSPPSGWYRTLIDEVERDQKHPGMLNITHRVISGPWKGSVIRDKLVSPDMAKDEAAAEKCRSRQAMYAKRLGLITSEHFGQNVRINWGDLIGKECFVDAVRRPFETEKGSGEATEPKFGGVYATDDPRVPVEARNGGFSTAAPGRKPTPKKGETQAQQTMVATVASPAKRKPAVNYDDL